MTRNGQPQRPRLFTNPGRRQYLQVRPITSRRGGAAVVAVAVVMARESRRNRKPGSASSGRRRRCPPGRSTISSLPHPRTGGRTPRPVGPRSVPSAPADRPGRGGVWTAGTAAAPGRAGSPRSAAGRVGRLRRSARPAGRMAAERRHEAPSVGRRSRGRRNGGRDASAGVGAGRPTAGPGAGGGRRAGDGERAGRRAGWVRRAGRTCEVSRPPDVSCLTPRAGPGRIDPGTAGRGGLLVDQRRAKTSISVFTRPITAAVIPRRPAVTRGSGVSASGARVFPCQALASRIVSSCGYLMRCLSRDQ